MARRTSRLGGSPQLDPCHSPQGPRKPAWTAKQRIRVFRQYYSNLPNMAEHAAWQSPRRSPPVPVPQPNPVPSKVRPAAPPPEKEVLPREQLEALSLLQLVDLIVAKLPPRHSAIMDMVYLRDRVAEVEEINDQARQTIEKLDAVVEKLRSPAFRVGTFLMPVEPDKAHVCVERHGLCLPPRPAIAAGQPASGPAGAAQRGLCRRARAGL
jgi:hypothetical protein